MRKLKFLCILLFATSTFASVINLSIQPMRATKGSFLNSKENRTQWVFCGEYGWMLGENLVLGPSIGFSWNTQKDRETLPEENVGNTDRILSKERVIMIPIAFFFLFDPFPQYRLHPTAHVSLGYNSVFISNVDYDKETPSYDKDNVTFFDGYYNGFFLRFGTDIMFDLGKQISLFAGPQWQFSTTERRGRDKVLEREFNSFGLRFGVSLLL